MRILFISNLLPDRDEPWRGLDNATLLHSLREKRADLTAKVIALRPSLSFKTQTWKPRETEEWMQPVFVPMPYVPKLGGLNHQLAASTVSRAIKRQHIDPAAYDLILSPWLFPDACGVRLTKALKALPQLAIAQGSDVHRYLGMRMRKRAILTMARSTQAIVTRSADLAKRLQRMGAPADRLHPIYNGVNTQCFAPGSKAEARAALQLPEKEPIALFVGNFLPVKGLDLLFHAIASLKNRGQKLHLALIGSGPLQNELEQLAKSLGISERIHWRGRHASESVAAHMQASDMVCLSSHNEGVPNVVLEAMASGRPVISTDVGGIHEVLGPDPKMHALISSRDP